MYSRVVSLFSSLTLKQLIFRFFSEVRVFLTIFLISFLVMVVFTNADMFWESLFEEEVQISDVRETNTVKINTMAVGGLQEFSHDDLVQEVNTSIENYKNHNIVLADKNFDTAEDYLKNSRKNQLFDFNVLPPTDRIVIPGIGLDVPVVDSKMNNVLNFTSEDFDDDLMSGVVKYPTTPTPGTNGNTLLFGHTSQEWWKNNDYSTVFNKLPKIKEGDTISIVWGGKLYNYRMLAKEIVYPKGVEGVYQKYQKVDEDYLTLMGCYPLGSTKKRILVIAKRVE